MAEKANCFIIMPITTPKEMIEVYRDKDDHFIHVLNSLFIPAVEKADYNPQPPLAKGADLIQANIISNLEQADIVLCDISCLNPNVFFEFGIRTSLNKPVCVVKDDLTEKIPFDTGILNHHTYKNSLDLWDAESEIEKLANHIKESVKGSKNQNTLWKYLGIKTEAVPYNDEAGLETKIDYLTSQVSALRNERKRNDPLGLRDTYNELEDSSDLDETEIVNNIYKIAEENVKSVHFDKNNVVRIDLKNTIPLSKLDLISHYLTVNGLKARISK